MFFLLVLMTAFSVFSRSVPRVLSVPVGIRRQLPSIEVSWVTDTITSSVQLTTIATDIVTITPVSSLLLFPFSPTTGLVQVTAAGSVSLPLSSATPTPSPMPIRSTSPLVTLSVSTTTSVSVLSETSTTTVFEPPATITISAPPKTVTEVITISATPTSATSWVAPTQLKDLDSFAITNFACGQSNLQIHNGIPAHASASSMAVNAVETGVPLPVPMWDNASSVMQLFYPANSVNPGNTPQGGADFYGAPVQIAKAANVTLEYSVFFPVDFDWVQGGKLPGLYGGHTACSGGDDAKTCFSTRMMWRKNGAGELYLYAPKDKQTAALCSAPPESICNAEYGLSVGRGSFYFAPGAWTHIRQTVTLNTPGKQDGGFQLEVNGKPIMNRTDVFYRDVFSPPAPSQPSGAPRPVQSQPVQSQPAQPQPAQPQPSGDGLLSPLLGGVLGALMPGALAPLRRRQLVDAGRPALLPLPSAFAQSPPTDDTASALISYMISSASASQAVATTVIIASPLLLLAPPTVVTQTIVATVTAAPPAQTESPLLQAAQATGASASGSIGFSGLFFSTFFGGNTDDYATPKDQYTWFKDFAITVNS